MLAKPAPPGTMCPRHPYYSDDLDDNSWIDVEAAGWLYA